MDRLRDELLARARLPVISTDAVVGAACSIT